MSFENPRQPLISASPAALESLQRTADSFAVTTNQLAMYALNVMCDFAEQSERYSTPDYNLSFKLAVPPDPSKQMSISFNRLIHPRMYSRASSRKPAAFQYFNTFPPVPDIDPTLGSDDLTGMIYLSAQEHAYVQKVADYYSQRSRRELLPAEVATSGIVALYVLEGRRQEGFQPKDWRFSYDIPKKNMIDHFYYPLPAEMVRKGGYHFPMDLANVQLEPGR